MSAAWGVLQPHEVDVVASVVKQITSETWFPHCEEYRLYVARHIFQCYCEGITCPRDLYAVARAYALKEDDGRPEHADEYEFRQAS